eukprot:jgi/Tetstr1/465829/TSEL_010449.t1
MHAQLQHMRMALAEVALAEAEVTLAGAEVAEAVAEDCDKPAMVIFSHNTPRNMVPCDHLDGFEPTEEEKLE